MLALANPSPTPNLNPYPDQESAVMPPQISGTLLTRFSWTYNRAAGAMLTTTATTAVSLLISGFSTFPMVQVCG